VQGVVDSHNGNKDCMMDNEDDAAHYLIRNLIVTETAREPILLL